MWLRPLRAEVTGIDRAHVANVVEDRRNIGLAAARQLPVPPTPYDSPPVAAVRSVRNNWPNCRPEHTYISTLGAFATTRFRYAG